MATALSAPRLVKSNCGELLLRSGYMGALSCLSWREEPV